MKIIGWKAWFIGKDLLTEETSAEIGFCALPDTILGIKIFFDDFTSQNFSGYDYYFLADGLNGQLLGCDVDTRERNVPEDIVSRYKNVVIKRGIWTDPHTMKFVEKQMGEAKWQL